MRHDEFIAQEGNAKQPKPKSAAQALQSLMRLAARSEKSSGDALRLMKRWGVAEGERAGVLKKLVESRFIDDQRYAEAYVREKSRLSGWGARKIAMQLRTKGVAQDIIAKALSEIDGDSQQQRLQDKLRRKLRTVKAETDFERRGKLFRYGLSQGFDYSDVSEAVEAVMRGSQE